MQQQERQLNLDLYKEGNIKKIAATRLNPDSEYKVKETTFNKYVAVAKRLTSVPINKIYNFIDNRRKQLKKSSWNIEKIVGRKMLVAASTLAKSKGHFDRSKEIKEIETKLKDLKYNKASTVKKKNNYEEEKFNKILKLAKQHDKQLYAALVIAQKTGCRPAEFKNGINLKAEGNEVAVYIRTAKKTNGDNKADNNLMKVKKGVDRAFVVMDEDLSIIAKKYNGFFKVANSKHLQDRLYKLSKKVDSDITFYSLRHNLAKEMRLTGYSQQDISKILGHRGKKTQAEYGV
ncbi:MAG: tyrosine-type recombinase/integrase [Candidatus Nanoarchaeia archaeon]